MSSCKIVDSAGCACRCWCLPGLFAERRRPSCSLEMVRIIVFDWTGGRRDARDDGGQRSVGTRTVQYLNICKSIVLVQYKHKYRYGTVVR